MEERIEEVDWPPPLPCPPPPPSHLPWVRWGSFWETASAVTEGRSDWSISEPAIATHVYPGLWNLKG